MIRKGWEYNRPVKCYLLLITHGGCRKVYDSFTYTKVRCSKDLHFFVPFQTWEMNYSTGASALKYECSIRWELKAYVSEEILNWYRLSLSLSADLCIHFYCLSQLRQAVQRKVIQTSALFKTKTIKSVQNLFRYSSLKMHEWIACKIMSTQIRCLTKLSLM